MRGARAGGTVSHCGQVFGVVPFTNYRVRSRLGLD